MPPEPAAAPLRVIVLAAQRKGVADPLADAFGVSHKCLVPVAGRTMIERVVGTASSHQQVASVAISIEPEGIAAVSEALAALPTIDPAHAFVLACDNLADSVIAAAQGHDGRLIVTTADNVLLTAASIDAVAAALERHDAVIAMARREAVVAAHPDGQRRFYRFRCGDYSNCNLYGLASPQAFAAVEVFRGGGQFAKKASRIVAAFGLLNLVLLRLRLVSLSGALARISRRTGVRIAPAVLEDGSQAIDVDNERTHRVASELLGKARPTFRPAASSVPDRNPAEMAVAI